MNIDGKTAVFGVIGDPVAHTFSPAIHRYFAERRGLNLAYVPFHVREADVPAAISGARALGIKGLNVTVPHKRAALALSEQIDPAAEKAGTVNTLVFGETGIMGYNTDVLGITRTLAMMGVSFVGRPAIVLGAGGGAYAACAAAADGGASRIVIANRTRENAAILATHVGTYYTGGLEICSFAELPPARDAVVIQTTTLGFGTHTGLSPVPDTAFFEGAALAFDIVYAPWETMFLRQAQQAGIPIVNGFPMLVYQAAASFTRWQTTFFKDSTHETDDDITNPAALDTLTRLYRG